MALRSQKDFETFEFASKERLAQNFTRKKNIDKKLLWSTKYFIHIQNMKKYGRITQFNNLQVSNE